LQKYGDVTKVGDAKAYEMMSCFLGILKYYKLTGEEKYLHLLQTAWTDITINHLYITGTASDHEVFVSPHDLKAANTDSMGEGCVTVTWIQFNLQLLQITAETKYADELERSVYNHLLAAENPQTGCVSYYTALQGAKPYRCDQGYSCCLSSVPRGISLIPEMIGGNINGRFTVLMYENGEATDRLTTDDHSNLTLKIKAITKFPIDGKVDLTINPSQTKTFKIGLRVPQWSENFTAVVGGQTYSGKKGQVLTIDRKWTPGDHVAISFDMPLLVIPGGTTYPTDIAIKRGPQVFAIDQGLNKQTASLDDITFAKNSALADADSSVPKDWNWKQAYYLNVEVNHIPQQVVIVPFSEAGQGSSNIEVWIRR
jgi:uncharacterized protein